MANMRRITPFTRTTSLKTQEETNNNTSPMFVLFKTSRIALKLPRQNSAPSTMASTAHARGRHRDVMSQDTDLVYKNTSDWAKRFPAAKGIHQSPINLNSRDTTFDPKLNENPLVANYVLCRETDIYNNGHTVVIYPRYKPGDSGFRPDSTPRSTMEGGPLPSNDVYELAECRFHWGREEARGSEHTVNYKAFPMEVQLIHWNSSQYDSVDEALGQPNGIMIAALFVQVGRENSGLKILTDHLEEIQYKGRMKTVATAFNPNSLLPDPMLRDFWTYNGSLTVPPCSENVTWILFRYPLTISHAQIEEFRRLRTHAKNEMPHNSEDGIMADNYRPTQSLNKRVIRASFQ
ncbi:carbonic anhydrase-related protein isoform X2 [Lingula anatina]|uniref:Carbonic anhydrase-related protein isoform X2 n=1 Tax=Lingula anatina TaxID=7574 RepID=A0A1S3J0Q0_LINAN|nr:carbonic anhydrase-related protein isoform X2 [Lingula anatina]|eukprot:XP_013404020.1 carbonic anhydrase-related protein isoform X2 [Lingula anatina]